MSGYYFTVPLEVMIGAWIAVIGLGAVISYYAIRLYRRTHERTFGFLSAGFALISVAAGLTWFGLWLWGEDLAICEMGSTAFMAGGFGSILYALRTRLV